MKAWIANTFLVIGAVVVWTLWCGWGMTIINPETMPHKAIETALQFAWGGFGGVILLAIFVIRIDP